jgi:hypothetical protein
LAWWERTKRDRSKAEMKAGRWHVMRYFYQVLKEIGAERCMFLEFKLSLRGRKLSIIYTSSMASQHSESPFGSCFDIHGLSRYANLRILTRQPRASVVPYTNRGQRGRRGRRAAVYSVCVYVSPLLYARVSMACSLRGVIILRGGRAQEPKSPSGS